MCLCAHARLTCGFLLVILFSPNTDKWIEPASVPRCQRTSVHFSNRRWLFYRPIRNLAYQSLIHFPTNRREPSQYISPMLPFSEFLSLWSQPTSIIVVVFHIFTTVSFPFIIAIVIMDDVIVNIIIVIVVDVFGYRLMFVSLKIYWREMDIFLSNDWVILPYLISVILFVRFGVLFIFCL